MTAFKYEKLYSWIKEQINSDVFHDGDRIPTELELSKMFSVSRDTVRTGISKLEDEGLLKRIKGSGTYVNSNPAANRFMHTDSRKIAIIMNETEIYIFPSIINGINQKLMEHGYSSVIQFTSNQFVQERILLQNALAGDYAGFIIEPTKSALPSYNQDLFEIIADCRPAIVIHAKTNIPTLSAITSGDTEGGYILTKYLLEQGHTQIGYFCKSDDQPGPRRYEGYLRAFRELGRQLNESNILFYVTEDSADLFSIPVNPRIPEILKRCSVVICHDDKLACRLHNFIQQQEINIKIAGFDNSSLAENICSVTVTHPQEEFGRFVAEKILEKIKNPTLDVSYDFTPELIVRSDVTNRPTTNNS